LLLFWDFDVQAEVVLSPTLNTTLTVLAVAKDSHEFHVLMANFLCPLCGTTENITVDITINELGEYLRGSSQYATHLMSLWVVF
jgi:hypothetical protein